MARNHFYKKNNRLASGELLSNERGKVGFTVVNSWGKGMLAWGRGCERSGVRRWSGLI